MRDITFITGGGKTFTVLKAPRLFPLVLLVKARWKQRRAVGSDDAHVMGSGLFRCGAEEISLAQVSSLNSESER